MWRFDENSECDFSHKTNTFSYDENVKKSQQIQNFKKLNPYGNFLILPYLKKSWDQVQRIILLLLYIISELYRIYGNHTALTGYG